MMANQPLCNTRKPHETRIPRQGPSSCLGAGMTKPVTRKMAVDCLLDCISTREIREVHDPRTDHKTLIVALICSECEEPLLPGQAIQFDHIHAHVHGGEHSYRNLRPIHYDPCHKKKTKADIQANAKIKRIRGETKQGPKRAIPSKPLSRNSKFKKRMNGETVLR